MKKNVMMRVASALLVAVLMTTCAISGTFAKYTTTVTSSASARVAEWAFTIDGVALANDFTFDLAETWTDYNGNAEVDVASKLLAPGTKGSFDIALKNLSEVNAKYSLTLTESIANLPGDVEEADFPVEYSLNETVWSKDITTLTLSEVAIAMNESKPITVYWRWAFESGNDELDTKLGAAGEVEVTVTAKITVTQVD